MKAIGWRNFQLGHHARWQTCQPAIPNHRLLKEAYSWLYKTFASPVAVQHEWEIWISFPGWYSVLTAETKCIFAVPVKSLSRHTISVHLCDLSQRPGTLYRTLYSQFGLAWNCVTESARSDPIRDWSWTGIYTVCSRQWQKGAGCRTCTETGNALKGR